MDSKEMEGIVNEIKATANDLRGNLGEFKSVKAKVDELVGMATDVNALKEALAGLQTKGGRPGIAGAAPEMSEATKAFAILITKGKDALSPEERKSLQVSDDTKGGYLVPPEFMATVIKRQFDFSPIRQYATVHGTTRGEIQVPREDGDIGASWVGENDSSGDNQATYSVALETVKAFKLVARVDVSNDLLEDSAIDVEALLAARAAQKFGVSEGTAFVNGTGAKQPEGFMINANVSAVASGAAAAITVDGMLDLFGALKSAYDKNAAYFMSKKTMVGVRKLKDTAGTYYWQAPLTAGMPATFNGFPIALCTDMADIGANAYPVAFGDMREAYMIVDSKSMSVLRDDLTQSDNDLVRFRFKQRTGGMVVQAEALKKLKIAASV